MEKSSSITSLYICSLLCVACTGYIAGRIVDTNIKFSTADPIKVTQQTQEFVPTVIIDGIKNKKAHGTVKGDVRFFIGSNQVVADSIGAFTVPAGSLLVHEVEITIPKNMKFVASKRGKKFYEVYSKKAQSITPENRVYFATQNDATTAGFLQ